MKPIILLFLSARAQDPTDEESKEDEPFKVSCPKLICDGPEAERELVENQCFKMRTEYTNEPIYARECFDASVNKKSDTAYFCPFNIDSG